jgi:hypothetical protein
VLDKQFPSMLDAVFSRDGYSPRPMPRCSTGIALIQTAHLPPPEIVGTWTLLHATARDAAGTARPAPYGGKELGRVTFTADGRMMSVVCDGRKELPAGVRPGIQLLLRQLHL